ncbi:unnamed protein product [Rotaria sordida]|uniref:Uncharacterized protein n=1 Tax=Rotaria sordida TaxID=392033 RepID=A0A814AM62_9BILA|nr:unnamed protein product [Rotaria sordida]
MKFSYYWIWHLLLLLINIVSSRDWLIDKITDVTTLRITPLGTLLLSNTLISREFLLDPDFATIDFRDLHTTNSSLLRCVKPEAIITLDGIKYNIGGIMPNTQCAYFNRTEFWRTKTLDTTAFHFSTYEVGIPKAPFKYTPKRSAPADIQWPPKGIHLSIYFKAPYYAPLAHKYVTVVVNYEMYDGIPLIAKWLDIIDISGRGDIDLSINSVELLAVNQPWSPFGHSWLYIEDDQPPGHGTNVLWTYDVEVNTIPGSFPPLVNCTYQTDHEIVVPLVTQLTSFRVHELVVGSSDEERSALSKHRLIRLLAPHTQENPIFFHMINASSSAVRAVIDQMAEVGFEMLIYSFGSGFDMESDDEKYIEQITSDIAYANSKGIEVGGYDLIALTRQVRPDWMAIDPSTGKPRDSVCFASGWYDYLLNRTLTFMDRTGLIMVETDGPYGGYSCASTTHAHHRNNDDSVYRQNILQANYFKILRERTVYINQPDYYFYQGGSKTGMGYNEEQYSLPRWMDISVSRQGMFDDTYQRIPTVGWMFVPLTVYHGGGAAAQFEPLVAHQIEYEWALAQYLGAGVAACYRGFRLYDTNETKALVTKWVNFYKKYRSILIRDIIHIRRADMQSIDSYMHINPYSNDIKGLIMVFNPTSEPVDTNLPVPLYYTGLSDIAQVSEQEDSWVFYTLARDYHIDLPIVLPPLGITWFLIR